MSEPRKAFLLRVNAALWRELESWAQEEFRSVNGQVEFLLREAVRRRRGSESAVEEAVDETPVSEETTPSPPPQTASDSDLEVGRHD